MQRTTSIGAITKSTIQRRASATACAALMLVPHGTLASALSFALAAPAFSQDKTQAAGIDLLELMPKIFLAYGGREALEKLEKSYTIVGEQKPLAEDDAQPMKFRQIRKGGNLRIDVEPGGDSAPISTVYDGVAGWKATGKIVNELSPAQTKLLRQEKDHSPSVLTRFQQPPYTFKLLGRTNYRAMPVYAIEVGVDGEQEQTLYIDEKNYQVVGLSYAGADEQNQSKSTITIDFSENRPAAGTLVPFKQVQYVDNKPVMELNLSAVDITTPVDEALFRRPDKPGEMRLAKPQVVPFEYSHKEILVKVRVNDSEPLDFLFDTAASQTIIDRRVAAETFLDKRGAFQIMAAGGAVGTQMTSIQKLNLGELNFSDIGALMHDMTPQTRQMGKPIAGIIGANVINKFAVTIDYAKSQLIFNDAATYKPPANAVVVPFANKQAPVIKAMLNGTTDVAFLVDTGAAFNNLPSPVAKKFLGKSTPNTTEGTGLDGRPVRLATLNIATVKVGAHTARNTKFTFSLEQDAVSQARGFVQGNNVGVLGNPFWQNFAMTLDYKFQRIILQPNTTVTGKQEVDLLIAEGDEKLIVQRDFRAAETAYQKALLKAQAAGNPRLQAKIWGRIGNLRRVMAKDLGRPEQARIAYEYFSKAQELAHRLQDRDTEGRILGDWSLLYLDNGQIQAAQQALQGATLYAPQDPQVNVNFAVYLYKMQMYSDMAKYIDKALFLDGANWQALWYKVKLAEMFSDTFQLKNTLGEIIKHYPWSQLAKDKLAALNQPQQVVSPTGLPPSYVPMITPSPAGSRPAPVQTVVPR